ncbi:MAG: hypothetical protein WCO69_06315 [Candidatus Omnitrophota bacterium]
MIKWMFGLFLGAVAITLVLQSYIVVTPPLDATPKEMLAAPAAVLSPLEAMEDEATPGAADNAASLPISREQLLNRVAPVHEQPIGGEILLQ